MNIPKTEKELGESLCDYCPFTEDGPVNTGPWNLCEGRRCEVAYQKYLDEFEEE